MFASGAKLAQVGSFSSVKFEDIPSNSTLGGNVVVKCSDSLSSYFMGMLPLNRSFVF